MGLPSNQRDTVLKGYPRSRYFFLIDFMLHGIKLLFSEEAMTFCRRENPEAVAA